MGGLYDIKLKFDKLQPIMPSGFEYSKSGFSLYLQIYPDSNIIRIFFVEHDDEVAMLQYLNQYIGSQKKQGSKLQAIDFDGLERYADKASVPLLNLPRSSVGKIRSLNESKFKDIEENDIYFARQKLMEYSSKHPVKPKPWDITLTIGGKIIRGEQIVIGIVVIVVLLLLQGIGGQR